MSEKFFVGLFSLIIPIVAMPFIGRLEKIVGYGIMALGFLTIIL